MSEQSEELQFELELANLLWPDYQKTYDENGDYWYMNDTRIPMPNFKGYVPKWTRDNDACLRLMCEYKQWPTQLVGGIGFGPRDEDFISCEMYSEIERPEWRTEEEHKLHVLRIAAVRAVIHVLEEKAAEEFKAKQEKKPNAKLSKLQPRGNVRTDGRKCS